MKKEFKKSEIVIYIAVLVNLIISLFILGALAIKGLDSLSVALDVLIVLMVSGYLGYSLGFKRSKFRRDGEGYNIIEDFKKDKVAGVVKLLVVGMALIVTVAYIFTLMFSGIFEFLKAFSLLASIVMVFVLGYGISNEAVEEAEEEDIIDVDDTDDEDEDVIDV